MDERRRRKRRRRQASERARALTQFVTRRWRRRRWQWRQEKNRHGKVRQLRRACAHAYAKRTRETKRRECEERRNSVDFELGVYSVCDARNAANERTRDRRFFFFYFCSFVRSFAATIRFFFLLFYRHIRDFYLSPPVINLSLGTLYSYFASFRFKNCAFLGNCGKREKKTKENKICSNDVRVSGHSSSSSVLLPSLHFASFGVNSIAARSPLLQLYTIGCVCARSRPFLACRRRLADS